MNPDRLSATFSALADPTRRAILARLALGEASVNELAEPFEMSLPAVSKHLKVLERAGLIARGREAQWRPCRLQAGPLKDVADWVEHYRRFWEQSFDRLGRLPEGAARQGKEKWPQEIVPTAVTRSRAHPRPLARVRRAARPGLQGVDAARASGALVGPARLHR